MNKQGPIYQSIGDRATETTSKINEQIGQMKEQRLNKLNKKLAEWAGWHDFNQNGCGYPPDNVKDQPRLQPIFTDFLDACFKWLVPKLLEEYNIESYSFKQADNWYYSETNIWRKGSTKHNFEVLHDEHIAKHFEQGADLGEISALALCLAIEKLIDKEEE